MNLNRYLPWPCDDPGPWAGVWLESVGCRDCSHPTVNVDPNLFCTHVISKGRIHLIADNDVDVVVGPGDLFSIWPHIGFRFFPEPPCRGEDVVMDWVRLRGSLARPFMRSMGTTEDRPWARAFRPTRARNLMRRLQGLANSYPPNADMTAVAVLHELAAACCEQLAPPKSARGLAHKIRDAMERQVGAGMNVEHFARAFRLSRSSLFLKFKEAFAKSPIQVLTEIRINHAQELLNNTDLSITEIAYAAGYEDPLYFSRQFRRNTGTSPRAFRTMANSP